VIRAALITISSSRAGPEFGGSNLGEPGVVADESGERLVALAESIGGVVVGRELIGDDHEVIARTLTRWADGGEANLILTSGGTGFAPSDVTPEATLSVIERPTPGIAEAVRSEAARHTEKWPLSRAVAGIRGKCLIINLPGSPRSINESKPAFSTYIEHAIALIQGIDDSH